MEQAVLYVGNFFFPDGNAAGKRVYGNLKAIEACGYRAAAFGFRKGGIDGQGKEKKELEKEELEKMVSYSIPYLTGVERMNNRTPFREFQSVFCDMETICSVYAVVMYGSLGTVGFNNQVIRYCRKKRVKVIYDQVDLYDVLNKNNLFKYVVKSYEKKVKKYMMQKCDGFVTISSYLRARTPEPVKTIVIPPLSVKRSLDIKPSDPNEIRFVYASYMPDKNRPVSEWKDRIDAIIDVFYFLYKKKKRNFKLTLIGFAKEDLLAMFLEKFREPYRLKMEELGDHLVFLPECSNLQAENEILKSDFSILLRDSKISTNAGFPTKVSESLSLGIPVVANITSDLDQYIVDGVNGFLAEPPEHVEKIVDTVSAVLSLHEDKIYQMKQAAIENCRFYYENYIDTFYEFFQSL